MEQFDTHEPFTTVREALLFSAFNRLESDISRDQKIQYVDEASAVMLGTSTGLSMFFCIWFGNPEVGGRYMHITSNI